MAQKESSDKSLHFNGIVPKFFYMALLAYDKKTNTYRALGIWSPHYNNSKSEYITIQELQNRTGIDFFCNLSDDIERITSSRPRTYLLFKISPYTTIVPLYLWLHIR